MIARLLYEKLVSSYNTKKISLKTIGRICGLLRRVIIKFYDPIIKMKIGKNYLRLPFSHELPLYKAAYPFYDSALSRICKELQKSQGYLALIDVGANIGDTVHSILQVVDGNFLCIEADKEYYNLLTENLGNHQNIYIENAICDEAMDEFGVMFQRKGGTSRILLDNQAKENKVTYTIDNIIKKYPAFKETNIIKVDTDGYDFKVLRGAKGIIKSNKPLLFFELSPTHLLPVGEDPLSIFQYLSEIGYHYYLLYDNFGVPIYFEKGDAFEKIETLTHYAGRKKGWCMDVLALHRDTDSDLIKFCDQELLLSENKVLHSS